MRFELSLIGRCSSDLDLEIAGTHLELKAFSHIIRATANQSEILLDEHSPGDSHYPLRCSRIVLRASGDKLVIRVRGDVIYIDGSADALDLLSQNVTFVAETPGSHVHLEFHPEHPFIDQASLPCVVSCRSA